MAELDQMNPVLSFGDAVWDVSQWAARFSIVSRVHSSFLWMMYHADDRTRSIPPFAEAPLAAVPLEMSIPVD